MTMLFVQILRGCPALKNTAKVRVQDFARDDSASRACDYQPGEPPLRHTRGIHRRAECFPDCLLLLSWALAGR